MRTREDAGTAAGGPGTPDGTRAEVPAPAFAGLLFADGEATVDGDQDRSSAADLRLDQVVASMVEGQEEPDRLAALFHRPLRRVDDIRYRQEVFADLADPGVRHSVERFTSRLAEVRSHLRQMRKMGERHQRQGWHLDAASIYGAAVGALADDLARAGLGARGLVAFRRHLHDHVSSPAFAELRSDTAELQRRLDRIRYCIRIRGSRVDVARYEGEPDYSRAVLGTFERFRQGAVADYRVAYRSPPGINHVTAQILTRVARLFPEEFAALDAYCHRHAAFIEDGIRRFARDMSFYLAYLDHIAPLQAAGLPFCRPEVTAGSREVLVRQTFDLALAAKLVAQGVHVVTNDVSLTDPERIIVVTGPNQGGKTTFARTFGQLHHLASLGCPVPGSTARLALFDRIFTHFAREEDLTRMNGRLEDDLVRLREILTTATSLSIIVLNEVFSSTTLHDSRFLGTKVVKKVMELDARCVYVTFVDELAALGPSVVSMMSTIVPDDPARRTFEVVRRPADGLAHALAIAEKHHVTYEQLRRRLNP